MNVQIQAHADSVTGDEVVVVIVRIVEQTCLLCSRLGGQATVDSGNLAASNLFDLPP